MAFTSEFEYEDELELELVDLKSDSGSFDSAVISRFKFNDISAPPQEWAKLQAVARMILAGKTRVMLVGHTDPVGGPPYNLGLGIRRAAEVRRRLNLALESLRRGSSRSVNYVPMSAGATKPIASNNTEGGREQNRRVQIFLWRAKLSGPPPKLPVAPSKPLVPRPKLPGPRKPSYPQQPGFPTPKPPGPIVPWPPSDVTVQGPTSGDRSHGIWTLLSAAATALGVFISAELKAISAEVLAKAIAAAEAAIVLEGTGKKGIGLAGEKAAEVILESELKKMQRVYNLNDIRKNFPLLDVISPQHCAGVKNFGALSEGMLEARISRYLTAYKQGTGRDWDPAPAPGSKGRKVSQAADLLFANRNRDDIKDVLPEAIKRAKSSDSVEKYILDCFQLYIPSDDVVPVRKAVVKYLASERGIALTINGDKLPGRPMTVQDAKFLKDEEGRIQSIGPSVSDFKVMLRAAEKQARAKGRVK